MNTEKETTGKREVVQALTSDLARAMVNGSSSLEHGKVNAYRSGISSSKEASRGREGEIIRISYIMSSRERIIFTVFVRTQVHLHQ